MFKPVIKEDNPSKKVFSVFSWIWFIGCFAVLALLLCRHADGWFHSDHSCDLILSHLLSQQGGILSSDWMYSTELMVFNSQLAYIPLFWLSSNWHLVHLGGIFILLGTMLLSCWYFCRRSSLQWFFPLFAAILVLPVSQDYFDNMLLGAYYTAYTLLAFLSIGLMFHMVQNKRSRWFWGQMAVLAILAFLSGTNGLRQLMVEYLPLLVASLFMLWRFTSRGEDYDRAFARKSLQFFLLSLFGTVFSGLGYLLNSKVLSNLFQYRDYEQVLYYIELHDYRLESFLNGWLSSFGYNTENESGMLFDLPLTLQNIVAFVLIFLVCVSLYAILRHPKRYNFCEYTLACFFVAGFLLFMALFLFTSMPYNARYNISLAIFAFPIIGIYLLHLERGEIFRIAAGFAVIVMLTASAALFYNEQRKVNVNTGRQEAVDSLVAEGYTQGYATYWNANILTELSNGALDVWAWLPDKDSLDPENLNPGLQLVSHMDNPPQGRFFVLFSDEEMQTYAMPKQLDDAHLAYEASGYTYYCYDSYDQFVADLQD